jgi:hypothetical protein
VLRPQVVNPQDRLIVADLGDGDVAVGGGPARSRNEQPVIAKPLEVDRQVPVGDRAQHGHPLAKPQVLANAELVDGGSH